MADFLVIVPDANSAGTALHWLEYGVNLAHRLNYQAPDSRQECPWSMVASFPRFNGSVQPVVTDNASGSWLLAAGTWFHEQGFASGSGARLLSHYLESNAGTLARGLNGFFCIVIGDGRTREVFVITDINGSYHAFLRSGPYGVALSGSSLLLGAMGNVRLDPVGSQEFLNTGVIYEDRTCHRDVRKLAPATIYCFADGKIKSQQRYWTAAELEPDSLDGEEATAMLWETLQGASRQIGQAFPRIVCDLTGGYDSRAVVAGFRGAGLSFATTVSGPADSPDVRVSKGIARHFGFPHSHMLPGATPQLSEIESTVSLTDGEYDLVEYAGIARVHRNLMSQNDIGINGSYGEVARGYWWELLFPWIGARRPLDAGKLARLRFGAGAFDSTLVSPDVDVNFIHHLTEVVRRVNEGLESAPNTLQMDNAYLLMRMQRWQGRIASSTNRLWPCLSPFLFRPVLETMLQTRPRMRLRSLLIRRMLARYQRDLGEYPLEHGYPALPANWRTMHRFPPIAAYYAGRILRKAVRYTGLATDRAAKTQNRKSYRLELWSDPLVQGLLNPETMRLAETLNRPALIGFMSRSRGENFLHEGQWSRVLTLECMLRCLERASGNRPG